MSLQDKLAKDLANGKVDLSAKDVAEFATPKQEKREEVSGDVKAKVPEDAKKDPMVNAGADAEPGQAVDKNVEENPLEPQPLEDKYSALPNEVVVTDKDRELFLAALVSGERFVLPFSIFGGKVTGKFRSRSQAESNGIAARINNETRQGAIGTGMEYSTRIRNMLLAAQLAEMNGVAYEPMKMPYLATKDGETTKEPGWLAQADQWAQMNEGLVSALYHQLQLFERKYWVMVNSADDQNFWNPAESTSV